MHILILPSEHFVVKKNKLAGVFQYEQARALSEYGFKVGVISVGLISMRYIFSGYPYNQYEEKYGIKIYRDYKKIWGIQRLSDVENIKENYINLFVKNLDRYIKENGRPEVIYAHNFLYAGICASYARKTWGIPFVLTEHSSAFVRGRINSKIDHLLTNVSQNAGVLSCVSDSFVKVLNRRIGYNFIVHHNIVDGLFFEKRFEDVRRRSVAFEYINVASLDENKNQEILLKSFASCWKGSNVKLKIIGSGPLKNKLINLAANLGVGDQVDFMGQLPREQVRDEMMKSDCFVLTSNYETFGVVLIEALACGIPVIATRCGGPEDIVNNENGYLIDVGSIEQLCITMKDVCTNIGKFNKEFLRSSTRLKFGKDAFISRCITLFEKAIVNDSGC